MCAQMSAWFLKYVHARWVRMMCRKNFGCASAAFTLHVLRSMETKLAAWIFIFYFLG
jgi:hypothetical protein